MHNMDHAPTGWRMVSLDSLAVGGLSNGVFKEPARVGSGVPLVNVADLYRKFGVELVACERFKANAAELQRYSVQEGDIFFTRSSLKLEGIAECNMLRRLTENAVYECHLIRLRPDNKQVSPAFLALWCKSPSARKFFMTRAKQVTMTTISQPDILPLPVPLPPLHEQHHIIKILDTLDETIQATEQLIAKLKQMKQGLLHDLLTRGIDENGELRDPERHPEQFKDSLPLGLIPKEWSVKALSDLSSVITSGSRGWASYYSEEGSLFIRIGNLTRENINLRLGDKVFVKPPNNSEGKRTALQEGDILISITADLGIIGVIPPSAQESYVNQHIALVRIEKGDVNNRWIGHFLSGQVGQDYIQRLNDSGAKAGLNLPAVGSILAALPKKPKQDALVNMIDTHDNRIARELRYSQKLRSVKKGLMNDLLTGKVRVAKLKEGQQ